MKFLYKKRRNSKISLQRREELIQSVLYRGKSITYASKKLRLKYSTARIIINKYKETGEIFVKDMHRKTSRTAPSPTGPESSPEELEDFESVEPVSNEAMHPELQIPEPIYCQLNNDCPDPQIFWVFYPCYSWVPNS